MLGFPSDASGVLVTGTSIANLIGLLVARTAALGHSVRKQGVRGVRLTGYTSAAAHGCIPRAMEIAGWGAMRCGCSHAIGKDASSYMLCARLLRRTVLPG
jgi:glutamate/tyrosine decarboxylase-like PLP-dependent enzyme